MRDEQPLILLVEDNDDDVFIMRHALKRAQVTSRVEVATDGQMAVDYLAGNGAYSDREAYPLPSIVFLDLKLPYLTGFEILSWMRTQPGLSDVIVVMLTSSGEERDQTKAYSLGARAYLVKPPKAKDLTELFQSFRQGMEIAAHSAA
jgi:CheY-like chemotaxis protein